MAVDNYARSLAAAALSNGGSSSYTDLEDKPKINGTELNGDVSLDELDIYSKQDIDSKMLNLYRYKGSVQNKSDLDDIDPQTLRVGDTYNVISTGMNYAWTGSEWDNLGSEIDLSNYYNKEEVDAKDDILRERINEIELSKFPNVTIFGEPTILQGQVSNFSADDYLEFPFLVDFRGRNFVINFMFTTGDEIDSQQNILDSEYGLAFAIRNKHLVMAISYDGASWAIERTGSLTLEPKKTYRVRISWNGILYLVQYSTDGGATYTNDISFGGTVYPYPKQMYIGVGRLAQNYFQGSINLNFADVTVAEQLIWQGMDDAGLALRADINLENITSVAEQKIKDIVGINEDVLTELIKGIPRNTIESSVQLKDIEPGLYKIKNDIRINFSGGSYIKSVSDETIIYVFSNGGSGKEALIYGRVYPYYMKVDERDIPNENGYGMLYLSSSSTVAHGVFTSPNSKMLRKEDIIDALTTSSFSSLYPTVLSARQGYLLNQNKLERSLSNINQEGIDKIKEIASEIITDALERDY